MTDRLIAIVVFVVLAGFVGILMWHVQRLDLWGVCILTLLLVFWDLITSAGKKPGSGPN